MTIPLSLYIHTPWCVRKCPYCDFNSHEAQNFNEEAYLKQIQYDLTSDIEYFTLPRRELHSIFIGGGTPSLLSPSFYQQLFEFIQKHFIIPPHTEITMEANPGTTDQSLFSGYYQAGINRLSLGIQSFNADSLKALGRIHDDTAAKNAIEQAFHAGFENINLDLMYGLPQQTFQQALQDIQTAISFKTSHISWYQLTLEPHTWFYTHPPKLPTEDLIIDMEQAGRDTLHQQGYQHYEISAYAKPDKQSQHNLNYWQYGDYLGIGAGAHSKLTLANADIVRFYKTPHPKCYLQEKDLRKNFQIIDEKNRIFEFMLNHLRLNQKLSFNLFNNRTKIEAEKIFPYLEKCKENNWITLDNHSLQLTDFGKQFRNEVMELFLN